jgi:hypothetical protein
MRFHFLASLVSRHRNKDKEDDDDYDSDMKKMQRDRSARMHEAMQRLDFATKSLDDQKKISQEYDREY